MGLLTNVQEFIFSDNSFTGTLPTEFGLLSENLKWFGFDNCELTGAIPTEWGQLSRIQWFMFWANDFTGTHSVRGLLMRAELEMSLMTSAILLLSRSNRNNPN